MDLLNKCLPKLYATTIILFLLHNLLLIKVSQAHSDCLFILGNTANNAYKESLVKKILNEQLSNFDKKAATFRLLTKDAEKWRSLLSEEEQLLTSIEQHHGNPLTIIVVYEGTDEMSLKEITLLSQLIQYAKHFALAEIGKGTTVQTITLLLNTAHCTHTGTLQIDSPNTVFLCNHIQFDDVPLLAPNSIVQNFELPAKILQRKHKNTIHATHTRRDMHYTIQQDLREGSKHKHRRSTKQKIEEMKILAKHARRRQHEPEKIIKLPITQKQLLCKYRKSCYETGIIPTELYTTKVTEMEEAKPEAEEHEVSEGEIKLACKYRKSCYEEFGTQAGKKEEPKKHRVLTGKTRTLTNKEKKKTYIKRNC